MSSRESVEHKLGDKQFPIATQLCAVQVHSAYPRTNKIFYLIYPVAGPTGNAESNMSSDQVAPPGWELKSFRL